MALKRGYRRINAFESSLAVRAAAGVPVGKPLVRGGFLIAKLAFLGALLLVVFWIFLSMLSLVVLYFVVVNHRFNGSKDFYGYQAYGDPYGEYELHRAPGQPDIDDK
jgi:fatty acid desaturase